MTILMIATMIFGRKAMFLASRSLTGVGPNPPNSNCKTDSTRV